MGMAVSSIVGCWVSYPQVLKSSCGDNQKQSLIHPLWGATPLPLEMLIEISEDLNDKLFN